MWLLYDHQIVDLPDNRYRSDWYAIYMMQPMWPAALHLHATGEAEASQVAAHTWLMGRLNLQLRSQLTVHMDTVPCLCSVKVLPISHLTLSLVTTIMYCRDSWCSGHRRWNGRISKWTNTYSYRYVESYRNRGQTQLPTSVRSSLVNVRDGNMDYL